jgi:hypothetical protein
MSFLRKINIVDQGVDALLMAFFQDEALNSLTLYDAVEHGHPLIARVLVALGISSSNAIQHAKTQGKPDLISQIESFSAIDENVLNAIIYWAITHYIDNNNEHAIKNNANVLKLLDRLLQVKKSCQTDNNIKDQAKTIRGFIELAVYLQYTPIASLLRKNMPHSPEDEKRLPATLDSNNHYDIAIHALQTNNYVALYNLTHHFEENNSTLIPTALRIGATSHLIYFALIGLRINEFETCLSLRKAGADLDLRHQFIDTCWSIPGIIRTLIVRNLNIELPLAEYELFNSLEKRDSFVKQILEKCLEEHSAAALSSDQLRKYYKKFDILYYHKAESKEEKQETKASDPLPASLWQKIFFEGVFGLDLKKSSSSVTLFPAPPYGSSYIDEQKLLRHEDGFRGLSKSFYKLLTPKKHLPNIEEQKAREQTLKDFYNDLQIKYNPKKCPVALTVSLPILSVATALGIYWLIDAWKQINDTMDHMEALSCYNSYELYMSHCSLRQWSPPIKECSDLCDSLNAELPTKDYASVATFLPAAILILCIGFSLKHLHHLFMLNPNQNIDDLFSPDSEERKSLHPSHRELVTGTYADTKAEIERVLTIESKRTTQAKVITAFLATPASVPSSSGSPAATSTGPISTELKSPVASSLPGDYHSIIDVNEAITTTRPSQSSNDNVVVDSTTPLLSRPGQRSRCTIQ